MKRFFQLMLGLVFTAVGFFGGWLAYLWRQNMSYWWAVLLALALLATAVWLNAQRSNSRWLSVMAIGYGFGAALITLAISYGRSADTLGFIILTALLAGLTAHLARDNRPKTVLRIWVYAFVVGLAALSADHLILNGRLFAWKWRADSRRLSDMAATSFMPPTQVSPTHARKLLSGDGMSFLGLFI